MILDRIENAQFYSGISPEMAAAMAFLTSGRLGSISEKTELLGDRVFVTPVEAELKQDNSWEAHRLYADIHVTLTGVEHIGAAPVDKIDGWGEYDIEKDVYFSCDADMGCEVSVSPGSFCVCFPWDAHKPCLGEGRLSKLVIKVRIEK